MTSEAKKRKRRKLNRKRKRIREQILCIEDAPENLQQQRLRVEKKPKQEPTLFFTVDETESRLEKRESGLLLLSIRNEYGQILHLQDLNPEAIENLEQEMRLRAVEKKWKQNREKQRRQRIRKKIAKQAIKDLVAEAAKENLQEQRSREIPQNHNVDAHGQENAQEQRLMEMQENRNVDAHDQRKREIEKQRRKARMRLDKIQPTVQFDELTRPRELMREFGFGDCEGF